MYNCFNIALEALKNKRITDSDRATINLLIGQYNMGIAAKKELYYKLIEIGFIKES